MNRMAISLAMSFLLVASMFSAIPATAQSSEIDDIDDNHSLDRDGYVEEFQENGVASTDVEASGLTITVAKESDDVDLSGTHIDSVNSYLRLENDNTYAKTFRIYLPEEYITPRINEELQAENSDVTAEVRPIRGGTYMEVRVRFTEPGNATFQLSKEAGIVFSYVERYNERLNETTGWELPSFFGGDEPWEYVPPEDISGERTVFAINSPANESAMVQFDDTPNTTEETWVPTPGCDGRDAPVCTFTRDGEDNRVYVLSKQAEPPAVRYKYGTDTSSKIKGGINDIFRSVDRATEKFKGWFSWGDGGGDE